MFILNDAQIVDYEKRGLLHVKDLRKELLGSTFYYFRLGRHYSVWNEKKQEFTPGVLGDPGREILKIPGRGYVRIASLERFELSDRIFAQFGQISNIALMGLRLGHSPFIDPLFEGNLELAVENCLDHSIELQYGAKIGKISFFDISDTYPVHSAVGTLGKKKVERRKDRDDDSDRQPWEDGDSISEWE